MKKFTRLVDVVERIRLTALLRPEIELLEAPERQNDRVGKLLEDAREDFAAALTGKLRGLGERRIFIAVDILREIPTLRRVFFGKILSVFPLRNLYILLGTDWAKLSNMP